VEQHVTLPAVWDFLFALVSLIQMLLHWRIMLSILAGVILGLSASALIAQPDGSAVVVVGLGLAGLATGIIWDFRTTRN